MKNSNVLKLFLILSIPSIAFLKIKNKSLNKQIYKIFLVIISIMYLILFLIIPAIWCYNPSILLNTKYEVVSKEKIEDIEETSLFIADHHADNYEQIILLTEILKNKKKFNIVSLNFNFITSLCKSLPLFPAYDLIRVDRNKKNDSVNKCIDKIKRKEENVIFFMLKKSFEKKGIYHILEKTKVPIVLVRFKEIPTGNYFFNRKFEVEYEKIKDYTLIEDKQKFMNSIKNKLYPNKN